MTSSIESAFSRRNDLTRLIEKPDETHIGYVIRMGYDEAEVMTNDAWRDRVGGLPQNCLLLATGFDPGRFGEAQNLDRAAVLLRVQGPTKLPQDDDNIRTLTEHHQRHAGVQRVDERDGIEPITHSLLQFGGLACRILGTFFLDENGSLQLGADVEDFQAAAHLRVYKPLPAALEKIVNYVDPKRAAKAHEDAQAMGFLRMPDPIEVGSVRYTSTDRLQRSKGLAGVPVRIQPSDFIARRTAVLGMTRTGKSNTVKTTVAAVALAAVRARLAIGQLIFDVNGEYANANGQDSGSSIAEVFADDTVRYRGVPAPGFHDLRDNSYKSLEAGLGILQAELAADPRNTGQDMQALIGLALAEPSAGADPSTRRRWEKRVAIYKALLNNSRFPHAPDDDRVMFEAGADVLEQLYRELYEEADRQGGSPCTNKEQRVASARTRLGNPPDGLTLERAATFFAAVRQADRKIRAREGAMSLGLKSSSGKAWLEPADRGLLNLLVGLSDNDSPIRSSRVINTAGAPYHSVNGSDNIPRDVYAHLERGRVVILDLSVGVPQVRERLSKQIAQHILNESSRRFTENQQHPPRVVMYVEEAHNLIGRDADFNDTWPRIAKEGAKFGIALVYATQEPSSVHPNIMANTENFFVTHLNNDDELRALGKYYDFADFLPSLKKAQDVGFARIKTLSSPFVLPTQILKFDPEKLKAEYASLARREGFEPVKPPEAGRGPGGGAEDSEPDRLVEV